MRKHITILLLSSTLTSFAQQGGGVLYLTPAIHVFSFSNLNQVLHGAGFSKVSSTFGFGSGGYGEFNRLRIGGEGTYFMGSSSGESGTTSVQGGWGFFYGGYSIVNTKWRIVPEVGFGFGGTSVQAIQQTSGTLSDLLTTQPNASNLSIGDVFAHGAVGVEWKVTSNQYIGLKSAYNLALSGAKPWETPGLQQTVADPFSGFQLSFLVGFYIR